MIKNTGHKTAERKVLYNGRNTENRDPLCGKKQSAFIRQGFGNFPVCQNSYIILEDFRKITNRQQRSLGARLCSAYGRIQAFRYGKFLSEHGVQVISGMAAGIDAEGHKGALEGGTPTFAVLGNGVDICYPSSSRGIYRRIPQKNGGIISEYEPGTRGRAYHFPARNRIISGLADLVLVVEAKEKSGSLITASCALEQGKMVYAIPGAVNDALSRGCHKLIYDGAGIAYSPEILLDEWGLSVKKMTNLSGKTKIGLATDLDLVYSCLDLRPKNLDQIIRKTGFSPGKTAGILGQLMLMGLVKETGRQNYIRLE